MLTPAPQVQVRSQNRRPDPNLIFSCGENEVAPIHPAKLYRLSTLSNYFVRSNDATYAGFYSYPADAINESCGVVRLELFSEKHPNKAESKTLDKKTVERIIADFRPYFHSKQ